MRLKTLFVFLLSCSAICSAYASGKIRFSVTDSVGEPEAYATVRIFQLPDTVKAVVLDVTDLQGNFTAKLPAAGDYALWISSVGKSTLKRRFTISDADDNYNIGKLVLSNSSAMLGEVEVVAMRPVVKTEIDRLVYDIQADEDSRTNTIFEMLRKVPLVSIDGQENVLVNGSSEFKIYKNGRPNSSWSRNPKDVLKSIPASMIKRIEVITEPGAKYEAEGVNGILNIVMVDDMVVKGVSGTVSGSIKSDGAPGAYAYVMAQMGKFTTTVNYGWNGMTERQNENWSRSVATYHDSGAVMDGDSYNKHTGNMQYGNMEASLEMDTLNLLTLSVGGFWYGVKPVNEANAAMYDSGGNVMYSYGSVGGSRKQGYFDFNGKLDYQHLTRHKGESIIFSYLLSTTSQTNDSWIDYIDGVNMPIDYTHRDGNNRLKFYEHTFQLDYTRPFGKGHKVEAGAKYILRINNSKTDYVYSNPELDKFTDFKHTTQVGALYAEYAYNAARWGARAGVRYEFAHLSAKYPNGDGTPFHSNIGDVVPTLSLSYKMDDRNSLKLNFATRINRPGISYLNPAVNYTPQTVSYGNPDLESASRHSLNLSYSLMTPNFTTVIGMGGGLSDNQVTSYMTVKPDEDGNDVIYSTYGNLGHKRDIGGSVYLQWRCTSKTTFMLNANARYEEMNNGSLGISNGGWNGSGYVSVDQQLPFEVRLGVRGGFYRMGASGLYVRGDSYNQWYGFSLNRSFLKENRLAVNMYANNPIGWHHTKWRQRTVNAGYDQWSESVYRSYSFGVSVSYRFGSFNAQVKKTAKTINNDDLEGRK